MAENQATTRVSDLSESQKKNGLYLCKGNKTNQDKQTKTRNSKWTDKTIRAAIDNFVNENGRPPRVKELDRYENLPPHSSIQNRYKMSAGKWLLENYPREKVNWRFSYKHFTPEDFKKIFITEYERIQPISKLIYNNERNKDTPSWQYIAKILGVKTWVQLKEFCGVNKPKQRKGERTFTVTSQILDVSEDVKKRSPYRR